MHEQGSRRAVVPEITLADCAAEIKAEIDPRLLRPADAAQVGEQARNLIANRALEIVNAALDAATRGNSQLLKYLFEEAGIFSAKPAGDKPQDSFSTRMLDVFHSGHRVHSCATGRCASIKDTGDDAVE